MSDTPDSPPPPSSSPVAASKIAPARPGGSSFFSQRTIRRWHLYLGCFFAPILIFYILTGWYQSVNPDRLKSPADAETILQKFRAVHTDLIYPSEHEFKKPSSPKLYRFLIITMAIAATVTILLGIILAFKSNRQQWPVWLSLILGLLIPSLLLWLGQGR